MIEDMSTDFTKYIINRGETHLETEHFWGKLEVRKEKESTEHCIDILVGQKGKDEYIDPNTGKKMKNHGHMIIRKDMTLLYINPRGSIFSVKRTVNSKLNGRLSEETQFFKTGNGKAYLNVELTIDEPTLTINVNLKEATLTET